MEHFGTSSVASFLMMRLNMMHNLHRRIKQNAEKQRYRTIFRYDSSTSEGHTRLMGCLLPTCTPSHVTRLFNFRKLWESQPRYPTAYEEVVMLCNHLKSVVPGTFEDPTCGTRAVERAVTEKLTNLTSFRSMDLDWRCFPDIVVDSLNPYELKTVPRPDFIVFSPPWELTDAFLYLMAERANKAVMALVASDYLTNAPEFRMQAWNKYAKKKKTHVIAGLPLVTGRPTRRAIWVIIAKSPCKLKELLSEEVHVNSFVLG